MTTDEKEVRTAVTRFYDAIEHMVRGDGLEPMRDAWHHTTRVTGGHPSGDWAEGWDEVWATWEVFASFGRKDRGGSKVKSLSVYVYGDVAYATVLFVASPTFGGGTLACTDILHRHDGAGKLIHHHADKSPSMGAALEKIAQEG